ncbi:MAG: metallophosphoesterase [Burkholderiales bacterium]
MRTLFILAAILSLAGCMTSPPVASDADYKYVVLGPEGAPMARVITARGLCPALDVDGKTVAMTVRMPAATIPVRPSRMDLPAPKASVFPVTTCEAAIPADAVRASVDGESLPLLKPSPRRVVILGDTGCRIVSNFGIFQACDDPAAWPFERIANAAAAAEPDLVIHVGDYHYREGPCNLGNAGCAGSPWGYGYDAWRADFFEPARKLLGAAPWIVVRGNHESCNRAGQGWWRFLDPRPLAPRQDCNAAEDDDIGNYSAAYAVPLGRGSDLQFLVFDSSWVGVVPLAPTDLMYRNYKAEFESVFRLGARTPRAFFVSHHPVLGFAANPGDPQNPFPGNGGLQSVLTPMYGPALFPSNVEVVLSGHNHVLEVVNFSSGHPAQLITGNGGDWADQPFPVPFPAGKQPAPGAVVAQILSTTRFGFMVMERDGAGWSMRAYDFDGKPMTTCRVVAREANCVPLLPAP